ncbi:M28 family metallopeptidase [Balneola vulgaris]|uniref:M28 family metallopeptidase n=1 Tax=Balneola vulgaris TaxID=287535 RepID=UPI0003778787|nr:M28 family metallopeptidase [Balneola vulgaris]
MKSIRYIFGAAIALLLGTTGVFSQTITPDELHKIGVAPSAERIERDIQTLVDFGTRHTLSDTVSNTRGIGAARRWIKAEFERISEACGGCLEVFYVSDVISGQRRIPEPVNIVNVVAIQRGTADPNRFVMMSGDIDSRVSDPLDGVSDSPGANDNASGMAGVIESARVLTQYEFEGSIMYVGLSGEEQGLFGGKILADYALKQGWRIKAVLNNDMIGNIKGINGVINNTTARVFSEGTRKVETEREANTRRFTGGEVDSPSRNIARYVDKMADLYIPNLDVMMIYRLDRFGRGGHHRPFNDAGIPGVRIMETNENYVMQHQDLRTENGIKYGDTIDGVDFDYAAKLTGLNAVTMASMAWAPNPPANVQIQGAVRPSTTLKWDALNAEQNPQLAGYKIYWRLTDSNQWEKSVFVPAGTTQHTLENVVIDNYYFGVASVSKTGFESPVVFPGPAGSFGE